MHEDGILWVTGGSRVETHKPGYRGFITCSYGFCIKLDGVPTGFQRVLCFPTGFIRVPALSPLARKAGRNLNSYTL